MRSIFSSAGVVSFGYVNEKLDVVIGRWNSLKGYVRKDYKGEYYKPRIEEAVRVIILIRYGRIGWMCGCCCKAGRIFWKSMRWR